MAGGWCHRLKHEGGAAELAGLRTMVGDRKRSAREARRQLVGYFENQVHQMDYPAYRAKEWATRSGLLEAACKPVANRRLKVTGARWSEEGANAISHLHALFRSKLGQCEAFWTASAA